MLIVALLSSAHACSPIDWELDFVFPGDGATVPQNVAPLAQVWTSGELTDVQLEGPDGVVVAGRAEALDAGLFAEVIRFVPDEPLPVGEYTLTIAPGSMEGRDAVRSFTVDAAEPELGTASMRELAAAYDGVYEGDSCDERDKHEVFLTWSEPDAAQTRVIALSAHTADPVDGTLDEAPLRLWRGTGPGDAEALLQVLAEEDPPVCVALKTWGAHPDEDSVSEVVCTENVRQRGGGGPGGIGGCSCSSGSGTPALGWLGALAMLGVLWGRRRR